MKKKTLTNDFNQNSVGFRWLSCGEAAKRIDGCLMTSHDSTDIRQVERMKRPTDWKTESGADWSGVEWSAASAT